MYPVKSSCLFFLCVLLSSCAVNYKMPDNRFMTPEVTGAYGKVSLQTGYGQGKNVELTNDYSQVWAQTQKPVLDNTGFFSVGGRLGILESVDLGLKYINDLGVVFSGKYQAIGKKGTNGFQLAVVGQFGGGAEEKSETNNTPTSADLNNSFFSADLIAGYRFSQSMLFYLSAFHDDAHFELKQTRGTVSQEFSGGSTNMGGTAGFELSFSPSASVQLEFARAEARSRESRLTTSSYGAVLNIGLF